MNWADLFDRASEYTTDESTVLEVLKERRETAEDDQ